MTLATNLLFILLGINLMLFLFMTSSTDFSNGVCTMCSPLFALASGLVTGNWSAVLVSLASGAWVYALLLGLVVAASILTGGNPLTGGGYGAILTPQLLAIGLFVSVAFMPNFAVMGMPLQVSIILNSVFGVMIIATVIGLLRGND